MVSGYAYILQFLHLFISLYIKHNNTLLFVGKELQQIANELIEEFNELRKLPSISYALQKANELYAKVCEIILSDKLNYLCHTAICQIEFVWTFPSQC
jgi:hypothetical protein